MCAWNRLAVFIFQPFPIKNGERFFWINLSFGAVFTAPVATTGTRRPVIYRRLGELWLIFRLSLEMLTDAIGECSIWIEHLRHAMSRDAVIKPAPIQMMPLRMCVVIAL